LSAPAERALDRDATRDLRGLLDAQDSARNWLPLARAITLVENTPPWSIQVPAAARPAHVIGITGPPGAGKSTLTGRLIEAFSSRSLRVAVIAVDPSSPISGGAVLGDRVRMERSIAARPEVFVRSLASRGSVGAVAAATRNVTRVVEATGRFDVVIVETVGAGQTEVAIARLADTVVLVTVPGLGDAVQAIKAGVMEIADMVVVNMADRPGVDETVRHLRLTLGRDLPVERTTATSGEGVEALAGLLAGRWREMNEDGRLREARAGKQIDEAVLVATDWVRACGSGGAVGESGDLRLAVKELLTEAAMTWRD
jgi:LAO/AO transport system kinase